MESSAWDGRWGVVLATDVVLVNAGGVAASGASAVALLVGPNAPVVIEPLRATHAEHRYDVWKVRAWGGVGAISVGCVCFSHPVNEHGQPLPLLHRQSWRALSSWSMQAPCCRCAHCLPSPSAATAHRCPWRVVHTNTHTHTHPPHARSLDAQCSNSPPPLPPLLPPCAATVHRSARRAVDRRTPRARVLQERAAALP